MGWSDQFQSKKFRFDYDNPEQIVLCQWQTDRKIKTSYLLFRMALFSFYIGIWYAGVRMMNISVGCGCLKKINRGSIFLYYTTWSEMFCCLASASSLLITITQYVLDEDQDTLKPVFECRKWFRAHLVFYTLALDSSVALAFGYFGYVYYNEKRYYRGISYVLHLWTGIMMLLDFMLSSMPTHLLHCCLTFGISFIYGTFTWIYYVGGGKDYLGGKYLYAVLNWEDTPVTAVLAILGTIFFYAFVRVIVFWLSTIRDRIFYNCYYLGAEDVDRTRTFVVVP